MNRTSAHPLPSRDARPRVLLVDAEGERCRRLAETLAAFSSVEMVGTVSSVLHLRERIGKGDVDVVAVDAGHQGRSSLSTITWLAVHHPLLSSILVTRDPDTHAELAVEGLLLGARAVVPFVDPGATTHSRLRTALLGETPLTQSRRKATGPGLSKTAIGKRAAPARREIFAIGASTGGPPVVARTISALPTRCGMPIVIVQHMSAEHMPFFVELLARQTQRTVKLARSGERLLADVVYVAPGDQHLLVQRSAQGLIAVLSNDPPEHGCRPAADPLFRSIAQSCGDRAIAAVMSGMGTDGASGAVALRTVGAVVVVQDQASSVVWGMPGAVVAAGAADEIVSAEGLAAAVLRFCDLEAER